MSVVSTALAAILLVALVLRVIKDNVRPWRNAPPGAHIFSKD